VGVFHWPSFGSESAEPTDAFCQAVYQEQVLPVVFGDPVAVETVLVVSRKHVQAPLDALPQFERIGSVDVLIHDGNTEPATDLRALFVEP
ncbi:MAG: hypothetical protein M1363_02375, partial [Gammaproteobacteria bacterium]|nr:hypothetical protein [Gammaproteobacteria bacterium]